MTNQKIIFYLERKKAVCTKLSGMIYLVMKSSEKHIININPNRTKKTLYERLLRAQNQKITHIETIEQASVLFKDKKYKPTDSKILLRLLKELKIVTSEAAKNEGVVNVSQSASILRKNGHAIINHKGTRMNSRNKLVPMTTYEYIGNQGMYVKNKAKEVQNAL